MRLVLLISTWLKTVCSKDFSPPICGLKSSLLIANKIKNLSEVLFGFCTRDKPVKSITISSANRSIERDPKIKFDRGFLQDFNVRWGFSSIARS